MDVVTILLTVAIGAAVPSWFALRAKRSSEEVLAQTRNGHKEPMRADIDRLMESNREIRESNREIHEALTAHRTETRHGFSALHTDVAEERAARRDKDAELAADIEMLRRRLP